MKKVRETVEWFDDRLRRACGAMTPFKRFITVLLLCVIFGVVNIYITISAIYNIGKKDAIKELQEIERHKIIPVDVPDNSSKQLINKDNDSE